MAKFVNEGLNDVLTWYLRNDQASRGANELYVGLYTDTTEPLATATLSSGLTELALAGYARIVVNDTGWTIGSQIGTNVVKTFTASEDWGNVYGMFVCNVSTGAAGELIYVEHFPTPFNVADTKTVDITPKVTGA